ncbi:hypothetical protein KGF54_004141 [Candida jiufengensis]|uniref:uncharacterized protein n=1 Tax=Candida jiufengensis TaxID=497108 RepID=UPI0022256FD3|nr:uncharacterized protein KGF54_004141 [Candida jiufengensis]KAI5951067.1 hypothetical protein KGF54_004141 [Candida jiufengensis]
MPSTKRLHPQTTKESISSKKPRLDPSIIKPNHTLYIKNLNNKINKTQLKHNLYLLFSTFDDIISIKIPKKYEAFIVFSNIKSSTLALRSLQNEIIFNKEMIINYAFHESKIIEKITKEENDINEEKEVNEDDVLPTYDSDNENEDDE